MTPEEMIRANAKMVVEGLGPASDLGDKFGYNRESVQFVEGFIERHRTGATPEMKDSLVQVIGSYLGECIIHNFGGTWREHEGSMGVFFEGNTGCFPFGKVMKQFQQGLDEGESILAFFDFVPVMLDKLRRNEWDFEEASSGQSKEWLIN